jgi:amino acid adenylation domain-containing protein
MSDYRDDLDQDENFEGADDLPRIAIVGMACRVPGANDPESFWRNVRAGETATHRYDEAELEAAGVDPALFEDPDWVPIGAALADVEGFDAGFFGFSPRDAAIMDPQHRHFLEVCWEALEDAGHTPESFGGPIGVFAGSGHNAYMPYNLLTNPELIDSVGFFLVRHTGNDKDFLATRASYCFGLTGPSLNIQTACSTSLVAAHSACQSLLNGECDLALAGGVTIELRARYGYRYEEGEILSPDGTCRAFDAKSQGTFFGSGAGMVCLRRLEDAIADGDRIHAVILGSAINNDGAQKAGYLAPSVEGQSAAIAEALQLADIDPATIGFIEAHGTGTPVGDPIEVAALTNAFRQHTDEVSCTTIGSAKSNIGHLDTAAGVAGLIKAVKCLQHGEKPPTVNFETPNPTIAFEGSPFVASGELQDWPEADQPRRAAVNSLGVGGTNAFMILEQAPPRDEDAEHAPAEQPERPPREYQLLPLSANSAGALDGNTERLAEQLRAVAPSDSAALADVAFSLATTRKAFDARRFVVCKPGEDVPALLAGDVPGRLLSGQAVSGRPVAFLFPGGGAQYATMARDLYDSEPVFREELDRCIAIVSSKVDYDLEALLFPAPEAIADADAELRRGSRTLPALFSVEYALAKLWISWGITPGAMLGHSMGEYTAACLAGVFSVEDGLAMVLLRGQLFEQVEAGAMLSIPLPAEEVEPLLGDQLCFAAINGPTLCVASGPVAAIERLAATLAEREIDTRRIKIEVAAHSHMLDPILPRFAELTHTIKFSAPELPFLSNVSGDWISAEEAQDPDYWVRHLRQTVQFSQNLEKLLEDDKRVLLEVAPGRTLTTLGRAHPAAGLGRPVFSSLRHPREEVSDVAFLLDVLGKLWMAGVEPDWQAFYDGQQRRRVPLPTYAFEHQRYWIEPGQSTGAERGASLRKKGDLEQWFYQASWKRALLPAAAGDAPIGEEATRWLIFADELGLAAELSEQLRGAGHEVTTVRADESKPLTRIGDDSFSLRPGEVDDYRQLASQLARRERGPRHVLHLFSLVGAASDSSVSSSDSLERLDDIVDRSFYSLLHLAQTLDTTEPLTLTVVTDGLQQLAGELSLAPARAVLLGPCRVIAQEFPTVRCRAVDVQLAEAGSWRRAQLVSQLLRECVEIDDDAQVVAYRGHERLIEAFDPIELPQAAGRIKDGGSYLITGGLGGIGLELARHLAETKRAKLLLLSRRGLPPRDQWDALCEGGAAEVRVRAAIEAVRQMEQGGSEVEVAAADVTDLAALQAAISAAVERFGRIDGAFHTAGVLDDGVIQLKERQSAAAVLAPKVRGTLTLEAALGEQAPDFLLLFSSVSSITGLAGQVDYAAANAFLDAFAQRATAERPRLTVAVNWNAWQEVGMAAELARELGIGDDPGAGPGRATAHPLLDRCISETASQRAYAATIDSETWLVDEHRLKDGTALIPGTGYLELMRAALADLATSGADASSEGAAVELSDVSFLAPFVVPDGEAREARVVLERAEAGAWDVVVLGPAQGQGAAGGWTPHSRARGRLVAQPASRVEDVEAIAGRCDVRVVEVEDASDAHLDFGPRWDNRRRQRFGAGEVLIELELAVAYHEDLASGWQLHPALLDMATAGAQAVLPGFEAERDFYVPLSYGTLTLEAPLTARLRSHVRLRDHAKLAALPAKLPEIASYDVTIYDDDGVRLAQIEDFSMRKLAAGTTLSSGLAAAASAVVTSDGGGGSAGPTATGNKILELGLKQGILPAEGMQALERVLAGPRTARVIVSSQDLRALIAATRPEREDEQVEAAGSGAPRLARPSLPYPYVAPETATQQLVCGVWQELLGLEEVGIHDDFFDLGGHSLLLTQLAAQVRKRSKAELPLRALFEKRTVAGIAEEIERVKESGEESGALALVARPRDGASYRERASFSQRRLWFLDQLEPGRGVYNIPVAFRLRGALDGDALRRALNAIVARHQALRTTFVELDGEPWQQIEASVELALPLCDLSAQEDPLAAAREHLAADAAAPFDLATGPLLRAELCRLGADDHLVYLNVHHIVCDGWSLALLFAELSALYRADLSGAAAELPEVPIHFADYSAWQQEWLVGEERERQLDFWRDYLGGELSPLELPADKRPGSDRGVDGAQLSFRLDKATLAAIEALARAEGTSLFMALLAAFEVTIARLSGQRDVLVGTPIANRDRAEIREAIGFYTNTVVFRGDLSGEPTFRGLLRRVKDGGLGVLANQDVPLDAVVEAARPERRGDNPLFSVMFSLQQAPEDALALPELTAEALHLHSQTSKFDLLLELQVLSAGLVGLFEYSTDLFSEQAAQRMADSFCTLLRAAIADPDRSIEELDLINAAARRELLVDFNPAPVPRDDAPATLHELVLAQCAERPDAIAVEDADSQLTYRELELRSAAVASRLLDHGVMPDQLVGICVERSVEMMVALLGILRAGGAYLPLDPTYPTSRLRLMLEDAKAPLLIVDPQLDETRQALADLPLTQLALEPSLWGGDIDHDADRAIETVDVCGDNLAYTIYTSGSTGRPKGVLIEHQMIVNFLLAMAREPGVGPDDRLLAVTTLSFDMSKSELWLPLTVGGTTLVASSEVAADGPALAETLRASQATLMQATPVTWRLLLDGGWDETPQLRTITGGEPLAADLAAGMRERSREVWNGYGPTEATVYATQARIDDAEDVTIGKPLDNVRCYILDERLRPAPIGVVGELYIGGAGVARGYLDRPALTHERFVEDPFAEELGLEGHAHMYRTGDLARWRADGRIDHLGRNDHQVKVRGYRIELGEIEAALVQKAEVREACVIAREDVPGDQRLVAYLIYDGAEVTQTELRKHLRGGLPDYMVPQHFVTMESYPQTPNGKIDRKVLPAPSGGVVLEEQALIAPRTAGEGLVVEVFSELLNSAQVGVQSNFFDLGGHSLLSMRAIARLEDKTGVRLSPRVMVLNTVEQIAPMLGVEEPSSAQQAADEPSRGHPPRPQPQAVVPPPQEASSLGSRLFNRLKGRILGK